VLRLNPNLRPPTGYKFIDDEGFEHQADTVEKLIVNLTAYRARVGKPAGDPTKEVHEQICRRHPTCCQRV
jgi:hypothetical protein